MTIVKSEGLQQLRRLLERQRDALLREGDLDVQPTTDDEAALDADDDARPLAEMNQVIASNRNRERTAQLHQIDEALTRMRASPDEFGSCEACDEPIPMRRLELLPWVRLCIDCQSAREGDATPGRRRHLGDYR
jgi:DnaK suppressor protein